MCMCPRTSLRGRLPATPCPSTERGPRASTSGLRSFSTPRRRSTCSGSTTSLQPGRPLGLTPTPRTSWERAKRPRDPLRSSTRAPTSSTPGQVMPPSPWTRMEPPTSLMGRGATATGSPSRSSQTTGSTPQGRRPTPASSPQKSGRLHSYSRGRAPGTSSTGTLAASAGSEAASPSRLLLTPWDLGRRLTSRSTPGRSGPLTTRSLPRQTTSLRSTESSCTLVTCGRALRTASRATTSSTGESSTSTTPSSPP
mmetsp:Transcript_5445/g.10378  ORF Transcript_5445/g.10378 Transcript_5445/m.10378 type:complete len:253 (+) Transcript_5445:400-1158(+)